MFFQTFWQGRAPARALPNETPLAPVPPGTKILSLGCRDFSKILFQFCKRGFCKVKCGHLKHPARPELRGPELEVLGDVHEGMAAVHEDHIHRAVREQARKKTQHV